MKLDRSFLDMLKEDKLDLPLVQAEAQLLDYIYTVTSWSEDWYGRCREFEDFRLRLAPCILSADGGTIQITNDELKDLLVMVPITRYWGDVDVGLSLKTKLLILLQQVNKDVSNPID